MKIVRTKTAARLQAGILLAALACSLVSCVTVRPTTVLFIQVPNQQTDGDTNQNADPVQPSVIVIGYYTNVLSATDGQGKSMGQFATLGANPITVSCGGDNFIRIYMPAGYRMQNQTTTVKGAAKEKLSAISQTQPK